MRLDLNLATHPYENAREFFVRWGALLLAVAAATAVLLWLAIGGLLHARDVTKQIRIEREQIASLQQEEKRAEQVLKQPQNDQIRSRSAFLNELIARKEFSWTQAFSDMEKLMPTRVHVLSMRPQLDADNQLEIQMMVASDSRDKALELLRKLEDSPHFRDPQLLSESDQQQAGGEMTFQISALYVPVANMTTSGGSSGR